MHLESSINQQNHDIYCVFAQDLALNGAYQTDTSTIITLSIDDILIKYSGIHTIYLFCMVIFFFSH